MKLQSILVRPVSPGGEFTLEEFKESEYAHSKMGRLLIALIGEHSWSAGYSVRAEFSQAEDVTLRIIHECFPADPPLFISAKDGNNESVRSVEDAVRKHLITSRKSVDSAIATLQGQSEELYYVVRNIDFDKAQAAIIAKFSKIDKSTLHRSGVEQPGDLYAFYQGREDRNLFVARKLNGEFSGGIARVTCTAFEWYTAAREFGEDGGKHQRLFFAAVAQEYVAKKLNVTGDCVICDKVSITERSMQDVSEGRAPYVVDSVIGHVFGDGNGDCIRFEVKFDENSLPVEVSQSAVGYSQTSA